MLDVLRRIVQEINALENFGDALQILVKRVREAVSTQACTVFLVDKEKREYVLLATDGLNPKSVGRFRMKFDQGLVGLVGSRGEPLNLEDAPSHPNFFHSPEVHEERFRAFLGAPIIHHRELLGVLLIQQEESRRFDGAEEAFLITMSAQLGGVIAHAQATGSVAALLNRASAENQVQDLMLRGVPCAPGIGLGNVVVIYPLADLEAVPDRKTKKTTAEITILKQAINNARLEIKALKEKMANTLPAEENLLFEAYSKILESTNLEAEIIAEIEKGNWAQGALRYVIMRHVRQFEAMDDEYLRERATDISDLGRRILCHLQKGQRTVIEYPANTILAGEEITASNLAEVPEGRLTGIAAVEGSINSHIAIMARALGVPTVLGIEALPVTQLEGKEIIVDGYQGQIYFNPSERLRKNCSRLIAQQKQLNANLAELRDLPAQTLDGHRIALWVNTGLATDAGLSLTAGAEGIGLYRTEIPFMSRDRFPTEEEQYVIYRQLLNAFAPRPVIMRTLDVGGDKMLPYFPVYEDNPFLGWRGIRLTLDHPEIFLLQIRAMLRANKGINNLRIMLPMITTIAETEDAKKLIQQAYHEILADDPDIIMPPVGVMLEVPSAVYQVGALIKRVDFLSIGSNDLTQYLLAVDRNNSRVANLYDGLHPAVLNALYYAAKAAHAANKPISICGELASDPAAVLLLIAMGFNAFSMNSAAIPRAKWVIRNFTLKQTQRLLSEVLNFETPQQIRQHLEQALQAAGLMNLLSESKINN